MQVLHPCDLFGGKKDGDTVKPWREARKAHGGCIDCHDRAIPGQLRCQKCQDAHNESMKVTREHRSELGLCRECGQTAVFGEIRCDYHKAKNAEYIARHRARRARLQLAS